MMAHWRHQAGGVIKTMRSLSRMADRRSQAGGVIKTVRLLSMMAHRRHQAGGVIKTVRLLSRMADRRRQAGGIIKTVRPFSMMADRRHQHRNYQDVPTAFNDGCPRAGLGGGPRGCQNGIGLHLANKCLICDHSMNECCTF